MLFRRSSRTGNTSRTVARKRLRRSVTTPFVTPVRVPVHAEGYAGVAALSFSPVDVNSPDVHRKHHGERSRGAGNDAPWRFFLPC